MIAKRAPKKDWKTIIERDVVSLLDSLKKRGVPATLRKAYYILGFQNVLGNTESDYKGLSDKTKDARMNGIIPIDCFVDDIRDTFLVNDYKDDDELEDFDEYVDDNIDFLRNAVDNYVDYLPRHIGQKFYVEIWLEKGAVYGSIKAYLGDKRQAPVKLNRGYDSTPALADGVRRLRIVATKESDKKILVKYFGDMDPSGEDMDRDLLERMKSISAKLNIDKFLRFDDEKEFGKLISNDKTLHTLKDELENTTTEEKRNLILDKIRIRQSEIIAYYGPGNYPHLVPITKEQEEEYEKEQGQGHEIRLPLGQKIIHFERVAITEQQIQKYNLPPKPVDKKTLEKIDRDSRTAGHMQKHGNELIAVEVDALDALHPEVIKEMVQKIIDDHYDPQTYKEQILDVYGTAEFKRGAMNDLIPKLENLLQELKDRRDRDDFKDSELEEEEEDDDGNDGEDDDEKAVTD